MDQDLIGMDSGDGPRDHDCQADINSKFTLVYKSTVCQTRDAKWLCLENIHQKFHRPNLYDIGGTYIEDVADFWFFFKTEIVGKVFLLHIFVCNRHEGSFSISVGCREELCFNKTHTSAYLPPSLKYCKIDKAVEMSHNYLTTYSFTEIDVELLKDKKLLIPISFQNNKNDGLELESHFAIAKVKKSHDFKALLKDPICSDFIIESADGFKFEVHKIILSAHSDVFKAMLKEDTAESQNNCVKLIDVSKEDLKCVLEFIYTGTIEDLEDCNFFNLLMLADRYNLKGLRQLSEYALACQLGTDNAIETLAVADLYNSQYLKLAALKFIKLNPATVHSSIFEELNNVELVRELCQFLVL